MTVPLDNLYDWISEIRDDILIYRFWPHGSRNLSDLQQVNDRYLRKSLEQRLRMIPVIAHDQEPLNFDLYQNTGQSLREFWMRRGGHHPVVRCHDHPRFGTSWPNKISILLLWIPHWPINTYYYTASVGVLIYGDMYHTVLYQHIGGAMP